MSAEGKAKAIIGKKGERFMRALLLEAMGRVMKRTPVDTGRARANWNVSGAEPDTSADETATLKDVAPKMRKNAQAAQGVDFMKGVPGYLANGLPYIVALEEGHSKDQAPRGMVRVTVEELRPWARAAARRIGRG